MDNQKAIELAESVLKNYDAQTKPVIAQGYITNSEYALLAYGIQNEIISERFTLSPHGIFLDGTEILPIADRV